MAKEYKPDFRLTPCCNASLVIVNHGSYNAEECYKCHELVARDALIAFDPDFYFNNHIVFNKIPECRYAQNEVVGGNWLFTGEMRKTAHYINFNIEKTLVDDILETIENSVDVTGIIQHWIKSDYYGWANVNNCTVAKTYGKKPADVIGWLFVALNSAMDLKV